ncbi:MAG: DegV family EDD domain-containing protein [Spirochaetales bacterium]|nr:DegV family EDD domain-containing protein [Spirochaetales bacterium]
MRKKVLVISGDNLGLRFDQINYPDIRFINYPVLINGKEHRETESYTAFWLIDRYKKDKIVAKSTSLIKGDVIDIIEKNKDRYDLIIHIVMSGTMSQATFAVAENIKEMFKDTIPIINIDTRQVSGGVGVVLLRILDVLKETSDPEKIIRKTKPIVENTFSLFVMADLNYLFRGGRIGKAKALLGSVLKIIPLVGLFGDDPEGVITPVGKGRTFRQVNSLIIQTILEKMKEKLYSRAKIINIISFNDNPEAVSDLKKKVRSFIACDKLITGEPRLVEAVYYGPGSYGIFISLA